MTTVTLFHSVICPRCRLASLSLASLREEFPDMQIEKVEYLTNRKRAAEAGVNSIPTLVAGGQRLHGFYLTKRRIRQFLGSLQGAEK